MPKISREQIKKERGIKRFFKSFMYSLEGLIYSYKNEQSMMVHFVSTITVLCLGFLLAITKTEWIIVFLTLTIVLVAELFNTAIEAIVDMVTLEVNPLAKIAKDCGSAATFVLSCITFVIILSIYMPYIMALFK